MRWPKDKGGIMRRGFGYGNRCVMTKKGVLGIAYIGLSLVFGLLISSCAPVSYDFIGTWNRQPDKLTYVNYDQHIKLTFPKDKWEVYTKPPRGIVGKLWKRPTKTDPHYHVMIAIIQYVGMLTQVAIEPAPIEVSLDEYLTLAIQKVKATEHEIISSKVVERNDRTIGLILCKPKAKLPAKAIMAVFKEEGRFTFLTFSCPEALFESNKDQFWALVDSYEYIE